MRKINFLNILMDNLSTSELLRKIDKEGGIVFTPNVDHLIKLQKDFDFYQAYKEADYKVCDSKILTYVGKFLGSPVAEKISGSDLLPAFYNYFKHNRNINMFLLGAAEGVAKKAQENINRKVGWEMVVGSYSPSFGFEKDEQECNKVVQIIQSSGANVLAVGLGAPKQEKWIVKYKNKLPNIRIFLAIGATIDFEAGNKPRAPKWMSEMGLEWFYRLQNEPERLWKRYLIEDMPFFGLVLQQKLNLYRNPFAERLKNLRKLQESVYQLKPIGEILKQAGLIEDNIVGEILQQQNKYRHLRFGELLVLQGLLKPETVDFFAEELPQIVLQDNKQPIGQYLKAAGLLDEHQINLILNEQNYTGLRFGELAVIKGWIKKETVDFMGQYLFEERQQLRKRLNGISPEIITIPQVKSA